MQCPPDFDPLPLVAAFNSWIGVVEFSYAEAATRDAQVVGTTNPLFADQRYLLAAPEGVGAKSAWDEGLDGSGVGLIDIEHALFESHEDLPVTTLVSGINRVASRGHGTGVLGVIAAIDNTTALSA